MHIGLDTVAMNGDGFNCHVKIGQSVKKGDKLITFDPEKIKAAGHPLTTMMVISEQGPFADISFRTGLDVKAGSDTIAQLR